MAKYLHTVVRAIKTEPVFADISHPQPHYYLNKYVDMVIQEPLFFAVRESPFYLKLKLYAYNLFSQYFPQVKFWLIKSNTTTKNKYSNYDNQKRIISRILKIEGLNWLTSIFKDWQEFIIRK